MNTDILLKRCANESVEEYKRRCYTLKLRGDINCSWSEFAYYANSQIYPNSARTADYYRKDASKYKLNKRLNLENYLVEECESTTEIEDYLFELKKERCKLNEERVQNNAYIRKLSREDTLKEIADNFARKMSSKKILDIYDNPLFSSGNKEAILCLSDWHYGLNVQNYFNTYSPEICINRVKELTKRVISIGKLHNVKTLHVVNLSDLICGRIHLTLRLESREDIISQTMDVSEILAEMLTTLSRFFNIEYRDCLDNHSRLEPNKKDSLELETMVRIIPWYLRSRLKDNKNIRIIDNKYADDIVSFETLGHSVVAVHGHKDKLNKVIDNMTHMTRQRNELILTGHFHHFSADENHECLRLSNGSLMGVDQYANDLRLTSKPSQNMIIVSKDDVAEAIYKIKLDI